MRSPLPSGFALVVAALLAGPVLLPIAAAASSPTLPPEEIERFVLAWTPRVTNQTFIDEWIAMEVLPKKIAGEGFHDLSDEEKGELVAALFEHLVATEPAFAEKAYAPDEHGEVRPEIAQGLLGAVIFQREMFRSFEPVDVPVDEYVGRNEAAEAIRPIFTPGETVVPPGSAAPQEPATWQASFAPDTTPTPEPQDPLDPIRDALEPVADVPPVEPATPVPGALDGVGLPDSRAAREVIDALGGMQRGATPTAFLQNVRNGRDTSTYTACVERGGTRHCAHQLLLAPATFDIGGNALPDVSLAVAPTSVGAGLGFQLTIQKLPTASAPLDWHAYAVVDIVAGQRLTLGLDGTPSTLPDQATLVAGVKDLPAALAGRVNVALTTSHTGASSNRTVTFAYKDVSAINVETNPVVGGMQLAAHRSPFAAEAWINDTGSPDRLYVGVTSTSAGAAEVGVQMRRSAANSRSDVVASLQNLPGSVSLRLGHPDAQGETTYSMKTSAVVGALHVVAQRWPTLANGGAFTHDEVKVANLPTDVTARVATSPALRVKWNANAATPSIRAAQNDTIKGAWVEATFTGVPSQVDLTHDTTTRLVKWVANAPMPAFTASTRTRQGALAWDMALRIDNVPAAWELSTAPERPRLQALSAPFGLIELALSNKGSYQTTTGNHAIVASGGQLLALSARLSDVSLLEYEQLSNGFRAATHVLGQNPFYLESNTLLANKVNDAKLTITNLPVTMSLTHQGGATTWLASSSANVLLRTATGKPAAVGATPMPPAVDGLSVRDGFACPTITNCGTGQRAHFRLAGAPTKLVHDPAQSLLQVENLLPGPGASLTLDVLLNFRPGGSLRALAVQSGLPASVSFTMGPLGQTAWGSDSRSTVVPYVSNAGMGPFTADIATGGATAHVEVSAIPKTFQLNYTKSSSATNVQVGMAQPIARIYATLQHVGSSGALHSGIELKDVPSTLSLSWGRVTVQSSGVSGVYPAMTYTASASTLDIRAWLDIKTQASLSGGATLHVTNLGQSFSLVQNGNDLRLLSTPATQSIEAHVGGTYAQTKYFSGCKGVLGKGCNDIAYVQYGRSAGVTIHLDDLMLRMQQASTFHLRPGLTSTIWGNYGTFDFWISGLQASAWADLELKAVVDLALFKVTQKLVSAHPSINVSYIRFDLADDGTSRVWTIKTVPCGWRKSWHFHVDISPRPVRQSVHGFQVIPGQAHNGIWYVTPSPNGAIPTWLTSLVAAYSVPGKGLSTDWACY